MNKTVKKRWKTLVDNEVHIYMFPALDGLSSKAMDNLSSYEEKRAKKFLHEADQKLYVSAHNTLRNILSTYINIAPNEWKFTTNDYGRPEISNHYQSVNQWLKFNLSHSSGWVVCSITRNYFSGVDIEGCHPINKLESLIDFVLIEEEKNEVFKEKEAINSLQCFYSYWTLKESYIKARGMGLSLPLKSFKFSTISKNPWNLKLVCTPKYDDNIQWNNLNFFIKGTHMLSIVFNTIYTKKPTIKLHHSALLQKNDFTLISSSLLLKEFDINYQEIK